MKLKEIFKNISGKLNAVANLHHPTPARLGHPFWQGRPFPLLFELHFSFRSLLLLSQTHEAMSEKSFCQLSSFQPHMLYTTYYFPPKAGGGGQWTLGEHECGYLGGGRRQTHAGRISVLREIDSGAIFSKFSLLPHCKETVHSKSYWKAITIKMIDF